MKKTVDNDFESFLKTNADELRMHPSPNVWKGIHQRLHQRRNMYAAAVLLLLLLGVSSIFYLEAVRKNTPAAKNDAGNTNSPTGINNTITRAINKGTNNNNSESKTFRTTPAIAAVPAPRVTTNKRTVNSDARQTPAARPASDNTVTKTTPETTETNITPVNETITAVETPVQKNPEQSTGISGNTHFFETPRTDIKNEATGMVDPVAENSVGNEMLKNNPAINSLSNALNNETPGKMTSNGGKDNIKTNPLKKALQEKKNTQSEENNTGNDITVKSKQRRFTTEFYVSPSISYRKLTDSRDKNDPGAFTQEELDKAVYHKPSVGLEAGVSWHFRMYDRLRAKAGVQINYNRFNMKASRVAQPEIATIALYGNNQDLNNSSTLRTNDKNLVPEWLENKNLQISLPVGFEASLASSSSGTTSLNMGITAQPSYLLRDKNYLLSTDLKNYTTEPSLTRRFNMNIGMEAFFSFTRANLRWHIGPQLRYQLFSTYSKIYPIRENLLDYGFKIGISKPF